MKRYRYDIDSGAQKIKTKLAIAITSVGLLVGGGGLSMSLLGSASAATQTVTVMGNTAAAENDPGGWLFNRDLGTQTPYEFNTDEASIGAGSLYVLPIENDLVGDADKFIAEYFAMTSISDIDSFTYDFKVGAGGDETTDTGQFYLNVYANFGVSVDDKFYDCRYNIVPISASDWTTVTFDPTQSYPVTTRGSSPFTCPSVPADMDLSSAGSNVRAFAINLGDSSASDLGLDGYFDNVVFTTSADTTTYDFEPALTPVSKNDCKKDGWKNFNSPVFKNQGQCVAFTNHN